MLKIILTNKKRLEDLVQQKAEKLLFEKEKQHLFEINRLRIQHTRKQDELQLDFEKQKQEQKRHLEAQYRKKINKISEENRELTDKVKYAQEFWRTHLRESDEILNIASVLESKALISLNNEKAARDRTIKRRTIELQGIEAEKQKIETIFLKAKRAEKDSETLMDLLKGAE